MVVGGLLLFVCVLRNNNVKTLFCHIVFLFGDCTVLDDVFGVGCKCVQTNNTEYRVVHCVCNVVLNVLNVLLVVGAFLAK